MNNAQSILDFWFGDTDPSQLPPEHIIKQWFNGGPEVDNVLTRLFSTWLDPALSGDYDHYLATPKGCLALIILLDQFSRNINRGKAKMFKYDDKALSIAEFLVGKGDDRKLSILERSFIYLPFEHSVEISDQERSVELFTQLQREAEEPFLKLTAGFSDYAVRHIEIIKRFGRFPHRNKVLGRKSTPAEIEFIKQPGSSF